MADDPNLSSRRARFEALALPHLDAAFNLARWLARDSDDARDIVQAAFLRAFDAFDGLRGANREARGQVSYEESQHAQSDPAADPAWLALRADERQRVDAAIAHLPPEFREVVVLRELEDLSYKEIAGVLSIPVGTVMSRLARGRHLLARYLTADGGGEL